jgi:hypothetical protein
VAVLGNGNAVTILDAEGIMQQMGKKTETVAMDAENAVHDAADERQIIIFMCSGTEYYAITPRISRGSKPSTRNASNRSGPAGSSTSPGKRSAS